MNKFTETLDKLRLFPRLRPSRFSTLITVPRIIIGKETKKNWKNIFSFQFKFLKSSVTPNIDTPSAKMDINTIFESACPKNRTDTKKLVAIATPPKGTIFKLLNLFWSFFLNL